MTPATKLGDAAHLTPNVRDAVRALYTAACHGAGPNVRWAARDGIQSCADALGAPTPDLLRECGCDVDAYWASRPIEH